jgi:hypothetical protein
VKIFIILLLLLNGCAERTIIQKVEVPVIVPCIDKIPDDPDYFTNDWEVGMTIWKQVTVLLAEREQRIAYQHLLRSAIGACVKK